MGASKIFLPYYVAKKGRFYAVYRYADESRVTASKVESGLTLAEAKAKAYQLNGEYHGWDKKSSI